MRLRTKMLLVWGGFVLLLWTASIWPIQSTLKSSFEKLAGRAFDGARHGLRAAQTERAKRIRQASLLIMNIPQLRALIAEHNYELAATNQASLEERLDYLAKTLEVEFVCVLDNRGNVIAQNRGSPWHGIAGFQHYLTHHPEADSLIRTIFQPQGRAADVYGLWSGDAGLMQAVGVPLVFGGDDEGSAQAAAPPDGAMIVATPISNETARELASSHGCELTFFSGNQLAATSAPDARMLRQLPALLSLDRGAEATVEGVPYRVCAEPLADPCSGAVVGHMLIQSDQTEARRVRSTVSVTLLLILCGGLAAMAVGSYVLSGAIMRPINQLLAAVNRVAQGDLSPSLPMDRRDELGKLATAFNDMVRQIAARREIERQMEESRADSRAKSQFLANMSHEVRTPLNGVIGMADLLLSTELTERQRRYVSLVKSSAEVLTTLVNDALDFAKIEAGKMELESIDFDLYTTIEEVVEMFAPRVHAKNLTLVCDLDGRVSRCCKGDPNRLRQVIINLLNNAIKFTEKGQVVVRAEPDGDDPSRVRISVRDSGIGIPPERLNRLFQAFSQVDASTTRKYGGTGLGLAICKQLAELMGGSIGVGSEPGVGSTFWFTARLAAAERLELAPLAQPQWRGMKVLLVEKAEVQRSVVASRLTEWGFEVTAVESPPPSQSELDRPFNLAIVGPSIDDRAAIDQARSNAASIPTLLLLRSDQEVTREQLRSAKLRGYITQPLRQAQMSAAITAAFSPEPPSKANAKPTPVKPAARSPFRILVADDHEVNQLVVAEMLDGEGFDCTIVSDGQQACDVAAQSCHHLILMDCQMPQMDGFQATRIIRQREQSAGAKRVPIIALTANIESHVRDKCLQVGMDAFCNKPIERDQLLNAVKSLLPAWNGAEPAESAPINLETVLRRCNGKTSLAEAVLEKLISQAQSAIASLSDSLSRSDAAALAQHAHGLKGTAGMAGAAKLHSIAARLESFGKTADLSVADAELQRLRAELARCGEFVSEQGRRGWPAPAELPKIADMAD